MLSMTCLRMLCYVAPTNDIPKKTRSVQKFPGVIHLVQERSYTPYIHVDPHHQFKSINLAFVEKG